jgi:AraC-like DNA-binding protein
MGDSFKPREISLRYGAAKDFQITSALVGCPVRFEQATNQIQFDSGFLDAPPKLGNRTTYPSVIALCDDLIADLVLRSGAAGRVRGLLLTDVAERLSFATVAKLLKTTPRTLRRHLRLQNTSFRELSDELRVHAALRYLRETTMTIEDIGFALGFSDSANFRHAFRRWTGKAPQDFRREPAPPA